ncbi:ferredoxin reductase [Streptomyces goshikiensis]
MHGEEALMYNPTPDDAQREPLQAIPVGQLEEQDALAGASPS